MALKIDESKCVLCGLCITDCPAGAFKGEGEHMVGQSRVFDSITLDESLCIHCGDCTTKDFWCPAEAIYDDAAPKTSVSAGVEGDGKRYSKFIYEYKPGDDAYADSIPADMPFNVITRFGNDTFPVAGSNFYYVHWILPHDEPFLEIGHPPHIHRDAELLFHIGTDPNNPSDLGSEIEWYMGPEMEKHVITKSCVIYIPPNCIHSPWRPLKTWRPWIFIEVNQGPVHTEKGYHQILSPEQLKSPDLQRSHFADDKY